MYKCQRPATPSSTPPPQAESTVWRVARAATVLSTTAGGPGCSLRHHPRKDGPYKVVIYQVKLSFVSNHQTSGVQINFMSVFVHITAYCMHMTNMTDITYQNNNSIS